MEYLNSIEMKKDTTWYHDLKKKLYVYIFLKNYGILWYPVSFP